MDGHLAANAGTGIAGFVLAVALWLGMVVVMMTPTVLPWVRAYATLAAPTPAARTWRHAAPFVAGYFAVWTLYSVGMAALQTLLTRAGMLVNDRLATHAGAVVLLAAGAYQFAPLKAACLTHCRNPLTYFLARWKDGPVSGVRLGMAHGWYCLGCCWGLMLTALAMGAMNPWWMAALTVATAAEQTAPAGVWLGRLFGAGLVAVAVWRLAV